MPTIAIIGASYLQRPLVERAREAGLCTICFAWAEGAVCRELCDRFYPISIVEKDEILAVCRREQIDGICTIASDVAAPTVAYVAAAMGLPANSYEAALRANNKYRMREALTAAGVDCPKYTCLSEEIREKSEEGRDNSEEIREKSGEGRDNSEEIREKSEEIRDIRATFSLPLIVKPSDRSGSMAVTKVEKWDDLQSAVRRAQEASFRHEAMVEEYIDGREISVEMISQGGRHHALQITDKVTTEAPHFVELAHHQPSDLPEAMQQRIFDITRRALDALGLTEGASHSEYKITAEGRIAVMEIGGRMGGDFIGSDLVRLSTGYDFLQGVLDVALGRPIDPHPRPIAHSGVYFLSGETPEVLPYIRQAGRYRQIVAAEQTDSQLHPLTCSGDRSGYFIYQDPDERFRTLRGKTVMVLGGGRYQLPLICAAREAGCRVLVMGWPGDFPGYALASRWYNVDIMDADAVIRIAREEQIDGIVGCGSDFILPTIGKVVDALGVPGANYRSSVVASDKLLMKQAFEKTHVRTAAYREVRSLDEAVAASAEVGYPAVLKIVDGSGSKGIVICRDEASLRHAYAEVQPLTRQPYMVLEQFVDGIEFGAQAYVSHGQLQFVMLHGDIIFHGESGVPVGHYAPAMTEYEGLQADAEEQLRRCVQALAIDNCAINADFILHDGQVYVLEIGARAGATCLPELVSECYGIDYYDYLLRGACGLALPKMDTDRISPALVYTPYTTMSGRVKAVHLPACREITDCEIYPAVGDEVHAFRTAYDRIGHLVMRGEQMDKLMDIFNAQIAPFAFVEIQEK